MTRIRVLVVSLALVVASLGTARAQSPDFLGSFDLTGKFTPLGAATTATLTVEAQPDGAYRVTRTGKTASRTFTWTATDATVKTGTLRVRFVVPTGGLVSALSGSANANTFTATYALAADGKRLDERVRNTTRLEPDSSWSLLTGSGSRGPAGVTSVSDFAALDRLARRDDSPGAIGIREIKFLMVDVDGPNPTLYLIDSKRFSYHYDFYTRGLGKTTTLEKFNGETYFKDARKNLAGTLLFHESYAWPDGKKGLFALEFWPTDPVKEPLVAKAYEAMRKALPFAPPRLAYHPAGETQESLYLQEKPKFTQDKVPVVTTRDIFGALDYSPLNLGEGFGLLRLIDASAAGARPPSVRDVVIFKTIPNDLSHVSGIITEEPQTPLSHINLKAKQNKTPNAFIKNASKNARIAPLIGKVVAFKVGPDDFSIREATQAEADTFLEALRPKKTTVPPRDLSVKDPVDVDTIGAKDAKTFGAKVANVGELRKILPAGVVPDGFGIPFALYDEFMKANGLYDRAKVVQASPGFKTDAAVREKALADFQREIRQAPIPASVAAKLDKIEKSFPAGQPIRCRSSTNNEDLPGFNGAGLYDSYTFRPGDGRSFQETVKRVWSSLWNFRAYEERDFYRIDHADAAMGVLVHQNFDDEKANGVAVTRNIFDPNWPGFYVNAQVGESLITNPDGSQPDEFLISAIGPNGEYETQYVRHTNQLPTGKTVLTAAQIKTLVGALDKIQKHFKVFYGAQHDAHFAMDVEWKFDSKGALVVKQARPYVE